MALVPSFVPIPAKYRGPSSSKDYNTQITAAYNDIVAAYSALQNLQAETALQNELIANQYSALLTEIAALEDQVGALTANFNSLRALNSSTKVGIASAGYVSMSKSLHNTQVSYGGFASYFPPSTPMPGPSRAIYSPAYGQITPSLANPATSKTYVIDLLTQTIITPPGVATAAQSTVLPSIDPFLVEENDITLAVDGQNSTTWRRNLYFPAGQNVSEVETTITLTVPQQYVNNLTCNYLTIHPYPEFGIDIVSVIIRGAPGTADTQLLPVDSLGNIQSISGAEKVRLFFPEQPVVSTTITFRQATPNFVMKPGLQCFTVGASVLDLGYMNFNSSSSSVLIPFTLANNFFQYVTGVGPTIDGVTFNLLYLDPSGDIGRFNIGQALPGYVQTVYVEAVLNPGFGVVPIVDQVEIQFYPLYLLN
jgi:hypothetical protein